MFYTTEEFFMGFVMETLSVNKEGNLALGGVDLTEVAACFGTPTLWTRTIFAKIAGFT